MQGVSDPNCDVKVFYTTLDDFTTLFMSFLNNDDYGDDVLTISF